MPAAAVARLVSGSPSLSAGAGSGSAGTSGQRVVTPSTAIMGRGGCWLGRPGSLGFGELGGELGESLARCNRSSVAICHKRLGLWLRTKRLYHRLSFIFKYAANAFIGGTWKTMVAGPFKTW